MTCNFIVKCMTCTVNEAGMDFIDDALPSGYQMDDSFQKQETPQSDQIYWQEEDSQEYEPVIAGEGVDIKIQDRKETQTERQSSIQIQDQFKKKLENRKINRFGRPDPKERQYVTAEMIPKICYQLHHYNNDPCKRFTDLAKIGEKFNLSFRAMCNIWKQWKVDNKLTKRINRQQTRTYGKRFDYISRVRLEKIVQLLEESPRLRIPQITEKLNMFQNVKKSKQGKLIDINQEIIRRLMFDGGWQRMRVGSHCQKYGRDDFQIRTQSSFCRLIHKLQTHHIPVYYFHYERLDLLSNRIYAYQNWQMQKKYKPPTTRALDCVFILNPYGYSNWYCSMQPFTDAAVRQKIEMVLINSSYFQRNHWKILIYQDEKMFKYLKMKEILDKHSFQGLTLPNHCLQFNPLAIWLKQLKMRIRRRKVDYKNWKQLWKDWERGLKACQGWRMQQFMKIAKDNRKAFLDAQLQKSNQIKKQAIKQQQE